jgi:hypothetical protein
MDWSKVSRGVGVSRRDVRSCLLESNPHDVAVGLQLGDALDRGADRRTQSAHVDHATRISGSAADCCRGNGPGDRSSRLLPRIKSVARAPDGGPVRLKPGDESEHRFCQPSAKRCELVLNARRHLCVDVAGEYAVTLEVAHGCREHALGYPRNTALEIREPPSKRRPAFENEDHQQAPLVSDAAQHVSKVAVVVAVFLRNPLRSLRHRLVLPSCLRWPTVFVLVGIGRAYSIRS